MRFKVYGEVKDYAGYIAIIKCDEYEVEKGKYKECMIHCFDNEKGINDTPIRKYIGAIICDSYKVEETI